MSSGGKSLVPRGGFNSTTPTEEAEEEEEESPWVSTEEEDEEEETQRRRRAGRSGRSRRRWRSDEGAVAEGAGVEQRVRGREHPTIPEEARRR